MGMRGRSAAFTLSPVWFSCPAGIFYLPMQMEPNPEAPLPGKNEPPADPDGKIREIFDHYLQAAIARLPAELKKALDDIEIIVDDLPQEGLLRRRGRVPFPRTILGLYSGTALPHKSLFNPMEWPGKIYLFRRNILRHCRTREELEQQIFITLMHELGHALGLDEEGLRARGMA
jgi:predicted Zn-dependent protease with MMP-like domain